MNVWDRIADNKPYPLAPDTSGSDEGDFRFPAAILCMVAGFILGAVAFIAGFMGSAAVALWSLAGAVACAVLARVLPPQRRPSR